MTISKPSNFLQIQIFSYEPLIRLFRSDLPEPMQSYVKVLNKVALYKITQENIDEIIVKFDDFWTITHSCVWKELQRLKSERLPPSPLIYFYQEILDEYEQILSQLALRKYRLRKTILQLERNRPSEI